MPGWPSSGRRVGTSTDLPYLADTSAWVKSRQRSTPDWLRERFDELLLAEELVMCDVVMLELLHHEQTAGKLRARRADLDALAWAPVDERVCARALAVQAALAEGGGARHRAVRLPDYLIAAAAELAGLVVLHYDADYDLLASVTGQPHEWVAPRGSV